MGAKTNGQVAENYYIFFNVLILMTTKRNTPERNLYSTPCKILRKQSQGNYKIIPAVEKGQMGPLKAYSRPTPFQQNQLQLCHPDRCLPNLFEGF